jgi:transposase
MPKLFGEASEVDRAGVVGVGEVETVRTYDDVTGAEDTRAGAQGGASRDADLVSLIEQYRARRSTRQARRLMQDTSRPRFTAEQRLLILDSWLRSKLPAGDFAPLVGLSKHTLMVWKAKFAELGPAGLDDKPLGRPSGSRLPEATKRSILLMKDQHPDWGQDRISAMLLRTVGFQASPSAVALVLDEAGLVAAPRSEPHGQEPHRFELADGPIHLRAEA